MRCILLLSLIGSSSLFGQFGFPLGTFDQGLPSAKLSQDFQPNEPCSDQKGDTWSFFLSNNKVNCSGIGKGYRGHTGEDWAIKYDTDVYAIGPGKVIFAKDLGGNWKKVMIIKHTLPDNSVFYSQYAHLSKFIAKETDNIVKPRDRSIAKSGSAGSGPHLHLEIKQFSSDGAVSAGPGYTQLHSVPGSDSVVFRGVTYWRPSTFIRSHQSTSPSPTASFTMSSQGMTNPNGNPLNLVVPPNGSADVVFDGSQSKSPNGAITNWTWKSNGAPICVGMPGPVCKFPFSTPSNDIELTVTDVARQSSTATGRVNISVSQPTVGSEVTNATLDGLVWPASGIASVSYNIAGPNGVIIGQAVPGSTQNLQPGKYTLNYISGGPPNSTFTGVSPSATQNLFGGGTITFTLQFKSNNQPPTAGFLLTAGTQTATNGQTLNVTVPKDGGTTVTFDGSSPRSFDPDGTVTGWSWSINSSLVTSSPVFIRPLKAGTYTISLVVTDNKGAQSAAATATIIVAELSPITDTFDFAVDSFSVNGNLSSQFFDDFNGTVNTPPTSAFACVAGDVPTESGGFLLLRSSDVVGNIYTDPKGNTFAVMNCILGLQQSQFRLQRGSGNSIITASFRPDVPNFKQSYGLQLFTYGVPANELIDIQVSSGGPGRVVITTVVQSPSGPSPTPQSIPIDLAGVQRIMLRLSYNDATGVVTPSFSLNNGVSFVNTSLTGTVLRAGAQATASVFGSVLLSSSPTPTTLSDDFNGSSVNTNLWNVVVSPVGVGTITEQNQRLEMVHTVPGVVSYQGLQSRCKVSGDFDVQVDFSLLNWPPRNFHTVRFAAQDLPQGPLGLVGIYRNSYDGEGYQMRTINGVVRDIATSDVSGKLRLVRIGSTISGYYWDGGQFVLLASSQTTTNDTSFALDFSSPSTTSPSGVAIAFDNFTVNVGTPACQAPPVATLTDNLTSGVLDSNRWLIEGPPGTGTQGMVSPTNQGVVMSMGSGNGGAGIYSRCQLSGDFDLQVDYALLTWQPNNQHTVQFRAIELPAGQFGSPGPYRGGVPDANGMVVTQTVFQMPTNGDTTGSLRFTRQNSTLAGYFRGETGAWILIGSGAGSSSPTRLALELGTNATTAPGGTTIAFKNFKQNSGALVCPQ